MTTAQEVFDKLVEIEGYVLNLPNQILLRADQIVIVSGLSDISESLGTLTAGEFRAGNRVDPGQGYTGMRMAYPGMIYNSEEWHLVGVHGDDLQFGVRATDGTLVAGGGAVILDETGITASAGEIGGWTIGADYLYGSNVGLAPDDYPFYAGETYANRATAPYRVTPEGDLYANNAIIAGEIRAAVFTYQEVQAVAGTQGVFKSAGTLLNSVTLNGAGNNFTMDITDPPYAHAALFAMYDIVRLKNGVMDTWGYVSAVSNQTTFYRYTVTHQSGTATGTFLPGQAAVNYGGTGQGFLYMTAMETNAPYYSVRTHNGDPYTTTKELVRLGNLNGYAGYSTNLYGLGVGEYASGKANITIDPTNGVRIRNYTATVMSFTGSAAYILGDLTVDGGSIIAGGGNTVMDDSGFSIVSSTSYSGQQAIRFVNGSDDVIKIYSQAGGTVQNAYFTATGKSVATNGLYAYLYAYNAYGPATAILQAYRGSGAIVSVKAIAGLVLEFDAPAVQWNITNGMGVPFGAGSAGGPSVYYVADIDTGIYFPTVAQIGFTTAGSVELLITNTYAKFYDDVYMEQYVLLKELGDPTAVSGYGMLYGKSDGYPYYRNDDSKIYRLGDQRQSFGAWSATALYNGAYVGNYNNHSAVGFPNSSTPIWDFGGHVPEEWEERTITVRLSYCTSVAGGTVVFGGELRAIYNSHTTSSGVDTSASSSTLAGSSSAYQVIQATFTFAGTYLFGTRAFTMRLYRNSGHASDTNTGILFIENLEIFVA